MQLLGIAKPLLDQLEIGLGRRYALLRLFLEGMQHIDDGFKAHRVDRSKRIAAKIVDDLNDARIARTVEDLRFAMPAAHLRLKQGIAHFRFHVLREVVEILPASSDPGK